MQREYPRNRASATPMGVEQGRLFSTSIPARLERLPWGRFHTLVVVALGITWVLDGLEVTLAGFRRRRAQGVSGAWLR